MEIRRVDSIKQGSEIIGNRVRVKVVKNKVAPPFKQAEFDILYGEGISKEGCILDMAVDAGVVDKSGAWYTYQGERLGQGREAARLFLKSTPDLCHEIEQKVRIAIGLDVDDDAPVGVPTSGVESLGPASRPAATTEGGSD
jgi:recombination protein RecA